MFQLVCLFVPAKQFIQQFVLTVMTKNSTISLAPEVVFHAPAGRGFFIPKTFGTFSFCPFIPLVVRR